MAFVSVALRFRVKGGAFLMSPGADLLTPNGNRFTEAHPSEMEAKIMKSGQMLCFHIINFSPKIPPNCNSGRFYGANFSNAL